MRIRSLLATFALAWTLLAASAGGADVAATYRHLAAVVGNRALGGAPLASVPPLTRRGRNARNRGGMP